MKKVNNLTLLKEFYPYIKGTPFRFKLFSLLKTRNERLHWFNDQIRFNSFFPPYPSQSFATSDLAALPIEPTMVAFYLTVGAACAAHVVFLRWGRGGALVGAASLLTLIVSLASIVSWISLYYYEIPTHHCPFDILQRGYGYIGYLLYGLLGGGVLAGLGVGVLTPFRSVRSLEAVVPRMQRRLAGGALILLLLFALLVTSRVLTSDLVLVGL